MQSEWISGWVSCIQASGIQKNSEILNLFCADLMLQMGNLITCPTVIQFRMCPLLSSPPHLSLLLTVLFFYLFSIVLFSADFLS